MWCTKRRHLSSDQLISISSFFSFLHSPFFFSLSLNPLFFSLSLSLIPLFFLSDKWVNFLSPSFVYLIFHLYLINYCHCLKHPFILISSLSSFLYTFSSYFFFSLSFSPSLIHQFSNEQNDLKLFFLCSSFFFFISLFLSCIHSFLTLSRKKKR